MDSRSRRLPFCLSSPRSSYTSSSPTVSSSSLGSSRLYSRETTLSSDRFPRASSTYKSDLDQQNARLLSSSRDYVGSDSRSSSWKLPTSLTSSSRSYERPWTESSLSSRSKLTDSEGRLGMRSGLLNASDDGDSKRAKLSYSNRGLSTRTPSASVTASTYSSKGLGSGRGLGEKQNDTIDSSWSSCRLLSLSSSSSTKSLLSRREQESKYEPSSLSSLGDRRFRTPGVSSSLYQTDRLTSTYAQGARPKESAYSSSSSSSSAVRESSLSHHLSSSTPHRSSPLLRDLSSRTPSRFVSSSSSLRSSPVQTRKVVSSSDVGSSYSSHTPRYTAPPVRPEATLPPRPAPEGGESEGRRSTRRLLSRLFSRRSSQDSSSGSSSVRSLDDDSPSTGGESVDGDEVAGLSGVDPDAGGSETTSDGLRNRKADLATIQEGNSDGYRSGLSGSRMTSWREPGVGSSSSNSSSSGGGGSTGPSWLSSSRSETTLDGLRNRRADLAPIQEGNSDGYRSGPSGSRAASWREPGVGSSSGTSSSGGTGSSWLSSSLLGRCPPLLSRLRRHTSNGSAHSTAASQEGLSRPQHLLRRWDGVEHKTSQEDEDDDDEEEDDDDDDDEDDDDSEEEEGAVGLDAFGVRRPCRLEDGALPQREDGSVAFPSHRRAGVYESISAAMAQLSSLENQLDDAPKEKPAASTDQEKLRKIKERLLLEESDEEEGDLCRICQMGEESSSNPLIQPCRCTGSLQFVHQDCIKRWLRSKIGSGTNLEAITTCELCKEKLRLNIDNFDIQELYRTHVQSEYDDFISSGLYLVVLLHFCEQRFSDVLGAVDAAGLFNLVRILHDHMDDLESSQSDGEVPDIRPSIEFSDLDDDLEEDY